MLWKVISLPLGNRCRFYPSCSDYLEEAVSEYGLFRGLVLAVKRISRCHPLSEGGLDFVPKK